MKIAFVNDPVYSYAVGTPILFNGAERQQWLLGRALSARGWSVKVGVRSGLPLGKRVTIEGIEFIGMRKGSFFPSLYEFFATEKPDWWYWRGADHAWGIAVETAHVLGVSTVFAAAFDSDVEPRRALTRRPNCWPFYAWGLWRTHRILLQHTGQLARLARRLRYKAHIVPSIAGSSLPFRIPHAHREKYVVWAGMLRHPKRPDLLVEVARRVPSIRFVVCGGPTTHRSPQGYGDRIVNLFAATPNIEYLGLVPPERADHLITNASALLSTSDEEGFPNTFLQAWMGGTPVVSLTVDPDEVITSKGLGMVSRTPEKAAEDLLTLLNCPKLRDEMGILAQSHVTSQNSDSAVASSFERAIYGKC